MKSNRPLIVDESEENDSTEKLLAGEPFIDDQYAVPPKRNKRWLPRAAVPLLLAFFILYSISLALLVRRSMPHCRSRNPNEIIYSEAIQLSFCDLLLY
jgi:hypothetical protein